MHPLNRKLTRDLLRLRGQALAIALIIASGIALLVMSLASAQSLLNSAHAYYERYHFADVFATVKRAPAGLVEQISRIPGVQRVDTRIVEQATLDIPEFNEPVIASLVSISVPYRPALNRPALRLGRFPEPGHNREVVVGEAFAEAHGLRPGSTLDALINGNRHSLVVVGVALSPEYIYAIGPGALMPDDKRYGVLWMGRAALEAAFDLDAAFNDLSLSLWHGASVPAVLREVDRLLQPFGGIGAIARKDQISNWFVMNEITQLRNIAQILPIIFLAIGAFLANMILARLIATERSEIGLLKAFGYGELAVTWHYAKLIIAMTGIGVLIGWLAGYWLGLWTTALYAEFFRFPTLLYTPGASVFALSALVSFAATLSGGVGAARRAGRLPPAEAMRPPEPPAFHRSDGWFEQLTAWLDQPSRVVLRQVMRWPLRSLLTSVGVGAAIGILISALQWLDAIDRMIESIYYEQQHQDAIVALVDTRHESIIEEFRRLPGVLAAEPHRFVAARLHNRHLSKREAIVGIPADAQLEVVRDRSGRRVNIPPSGLLLSDTLAGILEVSVGDQLRVEVLEGRRPVFYAPVVALFDTLIGTPAYMNIDALNSLLKERRQANAIHLLIDETRQETLFGKLKALPAVGAVTLREAAIRMFHESIGETLLIYVAFYTCFAGTLAIGVTYNALRIALSERGRELATLRVLGFHTSEISYVLLAEAALLVVLAIPLGCLMGYGLSALMAGVFETELFRIPLVAVPATYALAVVIVLAATMLAAILVHRRLLHLDLIAVLKTRE
jgi:putative ABC transport system permease protein